MTQSFSCVEIFWIAHEQAFDLVLDLVLDSSDLAGDNGAPLPHCLRHGEAKAFSKALLYDDVCMTLKRIHHGGVLDRVD